MTLDELKQHEPLWDKWYIKERLGGGSYGDVYKIERTSYDKSYEAALKVISIPKDKAELDEVTIGFDSVDETKTYYDKLRESISKEIDMMEQLKGRTNIVSYEDHDIVPHNHGKDPGYDIFIRMELLQDLTSVINKESKNWKDNTEIVKIGTDIAEGLRVCHSHNIIHRDIKLGNIFRSKDGDYKIGDFGIAKDVSDSELTMSIKGTFSYMAPEVYNREHYDFRADVYSLGMVMYHLLNKNRGPFLALTGPNTVEQKDRALVQRMSGEPLPDPVNAGPALAAVILKACKFKAEERYESMEAFKDALLALSVEECARPIREIAQEAQSSQVETKEDTVKPKTMAPTEVEEDATVAMLGEHVNLPPVEEDDATVAFVEPSVSAGTQDEDIDEDRTVAMSPEFKKELQEYQEQKKNSQEEAPQEHRQQNKLPIILGAAAGIVLLLGVLCVAAFGGSKSDQTAEADSPVYEQQDTKEAQAVEDPVDETDAEPEKAPEPTRIRPVLAGRMKAVGTIPAEDGSGRYDNCIYKGDDFSTIRLKAQFQVSEDDETEVSGTLTLDESGTIEKSGEYQWTFTPDAADQYEIVTGTIEICAHHIGVVQSMDEFNSIEDKASIQQLVLNAEGLTSLDCIKECTNLRMLLVEDNDLTDVSALKGFSQLRQLSLMGNAQLKDISAVLKLKNLTWVELSGTSVSDEDKQKVDQNLKNR